MRFLQRCLMGLLLTGLTLAVLAVGAVSLKSAYDASLESASAPRDARERVFSVRVQELAPGRHVPVMTAFGEIRSRRQLELRAAAEGPIVELAPEFADGTRVEAGQLLVRVDPADAQSALDLELTGLREAEAEQREAITARVLAEDDLAAARVQLDLRIAAEARQQGLAERGLGTAADRETAELAVSNARQAILSRRQALALAVARVDRAETAVERQRVALADARRRLAETELRAGFAGVLSGVTAVAGGLVTKNEKLGELIDPAALEVAFRVSTTQYARLIDAGGALMRLPIEAVLDVYGAELVAQGDLARVDAAVGAGLSGRLVFATLDDPRGFRPGDFVTLRIEEPPLDGVAEVPAAAIGTDDMVLVLGPEDRLAAAPAELLRRQGDRAIIRVGALAGREIVTERSPLLGAGIKVRPIRATAGARVGDAAMTAPDEAAAIVGELIDLTPERRAGLVAFVEQSRQMPAEAKARVLAALRETRVPAEIVRRIEARMGG